MAGKRLTSLTETTFLDNEDRVYIEDVSEATNSQSKWIRKDNLQSTLNLSSSTGSRLISGGMQWVTGLQYQSINLVYEIAGSQFAITDGTSVTLDAADGSNPRIDLIFGDDLGVLGKSTGTPASTPTANTLPAHQFQLTLATIATSATTPTGVSIRTVYVEDAGQSAEFDATENTSAARIVMDNTSSPLTGSKDIKTTAAITDGDLITFIHSTATTLTNLSSIGLDIKVLADWSNDYLILKLLDSSVEVGTVNIDSAFLVIDFTTTTTQTLTIFKADFSFVSGQTEFDKIEIYNRVRGSSSILYQMDEIYIFEDADTVEPISVTASDVSVDAGAFSGSLSSSDDNVQDALETLDDGLVNDTTPQLGGSLDTNAFSVEWSKGADVASATELLLLRDGNYFDITGTTTITTIEDSADAWKVGAIAVLQFDDILTLTHHATNLILPSAANIATVAGDIAIMQKVASGDWKCVSYNRASGTALIGDGTGDALVANPLSQFAATTSAQLAGVISNETGSALLVFNTSPTLVTPLLGTPTSGVLSNCTAYPTGTTSLEGALELATVAEVKTGTSTALAVTPEGVNKRNESIGFAASDETTLIAVADDVLNINMPNYATTLSGISASLVTAPTGSVATFDVEEAGSTILSTLITIDATEFTSETAATPPVISDTAIAANAILSFNIDGVGSTIAGKGLKFWIYFNRA